MVFPSVYFTSEPPTSPDVLTSVRTPTPFLLTPSGTPPDPDPDPVLDPDPDLDPDPLPPDFSRTPLDQDPPDSDPELRHKVRFDHTRQRFGPESSSGVGSEGPRSRYSPRTGVQTTGKSHLDREDGG